MSTCPGSNRKIKDPQIYTVLCPECHRRVKWTQEEYATIEVTGTLQIGGQVEVFDGEEETVYSDNYFIVEHEAHGWLKDNNFKNCVKIARTIQVLSSLMEVLDEHEFQGNAQIADAIKELCTPKCPDWILAVEFEERSKEMKELGDLEISYVYSFIGRIFRSELIHVPIYPIQQKFNSLEEVLSFFERFWEERKK